MVRLATNRASGARVAMKVVKLPRPGQRTNEHACSRAAILREVEALLDLDHPCVVRLHEYFVSTPSGGGSSGSSSSRSSSLQQGSASGASGASARSPPGSPLASKSSGGSSSSSSGSGSGSGGRSRLYLAMDYLEGGRKGCSAGHAACDHSARHAAAAAAPAPAPASSCPPMPTHLCPALPPSPSTGGELLEVLDERGRFSEADAAVVFRRLLLGVQYLHDM